MAYQFIIFIVIVQSILFLAHWLLYRAVVFFLALTSPSVTLPLKTVLFLFSISLVGTSLLIFRYPNVLVGMAYVLAASWLGFLNFFILASVSSWIIYITVRTLSFSPYRKFLACILFGLAIVVGIYGIINARTTRIRDSQNRQKYEMILNGIKINPNAPTILLKHSPNNLDIAHKKGITLQLSGHTHKGQIFPINFITGLVYHGYDYGFKKFKDLQIYTSSGVGTWGPPMRVGNIPEIAVIKFE
jgi:hypothetical protein